MNTDNHKIKVLMIGPGEGAIGGIMSLVETVRPVLRGPVNLCYLPTVGERAAEESGQWSIRNIGYTGSQYTRFLAQLFLFHPGIIHLHTSQGLAWLKDTFFVVIGRLLGCKVLIHVHAFDPEGLYFPGHPFLRWYSGKVFELADAVVVVSAEWAANLCKLVSATKIHALTNCINVAHIGPSSRPTCDKDVNILFVGSVGPRKGAFDLIEALSRLNTEGHNLRAWIVGFEEQDGCLAQARKRLKELQLENTCEILGHVVGDKKLQLFGGADLFVLPSHNEGLPIAILEALAAGLPIVSSPVGGIPGVVRDGYNGFLANPGDISTLAEKIAVLLKDADLRDVMGKRSREIAEHELDVLPYTEKLLGLYERLSNS